MLGSCLMVRGSLKLRRLLRYKKFKKEIGMESGDEIDVVVEQVGGKLVNKLL